MHDGLVRSIQKNNEPKQVAYLVDQIQLEQKYLLLPELERGILDVFFDKKIPLNEFSLRIEIYIRKSKELLEKAGKRAGVKLSNIHIGDNVKVSDFITDQRKDLAEHLNNLKARQVEVFFSQMKENTDISLPSNRSVSSACENLAQKFLKVVVRKQGKKVFKTYTLDPDFYATWSNVRSQLINAIEKNQISKKSLTDLSKRFWQIS